MFSHTKKRLIDMLTISKTDDPSPKISVELLHFFTGACLVVCGGITYLTEGFGMMLSWAIFGAMYISMSDIGEDSMSEEKRASKRHQVRVYFAYFGALLSVLLLVYSTMQYASS